MLPQYTQAQQNPPELEPVPAVVTEQTLESRLNLVKNKANNIVKEYGDMQIGYSIWHIPTDTSVSHNGDKLFPLASVFKIPVMLNLCTQIQNGQLPYNLDSQLTIHKSDYCIGSGILQKSPVNSKLMLDKAVNLMITISDNTATDMLINLMGTDSLSRYMPNLGLTNNRIFMTNRQAWLISLGSGSLLHDSNPDYIARVWKGLSYEQQRELAKEVAAGNSDLSLNSFQTLEDQSGAKYTYTQCRNCAETVDNLASPNDFSAMLAKLWRRELLSDDWTEYTLSVLAAQKYNSRIPRYLPKGTKTYHKTGTLTGIVNDSGILISKEGTPIAVSVFVKHVNCNQETRAAEAIGKIAKIAWQEL
ncbi:serine hydrolase [bacterium]|nr:serine hydrolase [bacterium]